MSSTAETPVPAEPTAAQAAETMRSRPYVGLLVVASVIGVIVSLAAWGYLESVFQIQQELFTHLPHALGYEQGPPLWWSLPVLGVGGLIVALAITLLPGDGGHVPAKGLGAGGITSPLDLPGVLLAGFAGLGFGVVLGPEGPLLALGSGLAVLAIRLARREVEPPVLGVIAAAGSCAALSFVFASPLIAAVILIEATALGGARQRLVLLPALLAAGIGTLVSIGMGSFTGLSSRDYALGALPLPHFGHPDIAQFGWTIALAIAVAVAVRPIMLGGLFTHRVVVRRIVILLPIVGLIIAGLAIAFHGATGKSVNEVLFSGQEALPGLLRQAGTWSLGALALVIVFKGLAYMLSLGSFRGGPVFPALFLAAAGGIMASRLPGFTLTPAVAVGMGAGIAAVLRLPLAAVVLATLLTANSGTGDEPLIIVGVVVAYLITLKISAPAPAASQAGDGAGVAQTPTPELPAVAPGGSRDGSPTAAPAA